MTRNQNNKQDGDAAEDFADLARRFADLWQDQLSAMAADPALAKSVQDSMAVWQQLTPGVAGGGDPAKDPMAAFRQAADVWTGMMQPAQRPNTDGTSDEPSTTDPSHGSTAAAGSSDSGERLLRELDRRLARLEQRLNRLESGAGGDGGGSKRGGGTKKPAGKRSAAKRGTAKRGAGGPGT
ncbi:hypothetical protein [Pacificispira sp.]|uniref:hypothetical protein n=1 Tax=Pacificispira sp. TaxID=2888761 RepID=UPI003BABDA69